METAGQALNWQGYNPLIVLVIAAGLDYGLGDPQGWVHPVQVMGWVIQAYVRSVFQLWGTPQSSQAQVRRWMFKVAGVLLGLGLVLGSGVMGWVLITGATSIHPLAGSAIASLLLAACFAGRSLRNAAEDVLQALVAGDLPEARSRLSQYVGRDTEQLSEAEVLRAVLETVTENATDGVMAPLFYAMVGAALPGVGSVPLALAYKAASTLDSMVGYREAPYTDLGWFSARMEDGLTWLPCRLTVLTLGWLSGKPRYVWQLCQRDAVADSSPNSGWSECAYAAILGVQVGGTNWYRGVAKFKPLLGEPIQAIAPHHIRQAIFLTRVCFLVWLSLAIAVLSWQSFIALR